MTSSKKEQFAFNFICERQKAWAQVNGIILNSNRNNMYVRELSDNLIIPLSDREFEEFDTGGQETSDHMFALHSSSALTFNFFQIWRVKELVDALGESLFSTSGFDRISFEEPFPTGLPGMSPHLDVLLEGKNLEPVAIECKFTEPYYQKLPSPSIRDPYFNDDLWTGLPKCYELLESIASRKIRFTRLDAVQLLKHTLGLSKRYGVSGFKLVYLWYNFTCGEATTLEKEIAIFEEEIADEVDFQSITYQDAIIALDKYRSVIHDYFAYMEKRYFDDTLQAKIRDKDGDLITFDTKVIGMRASGDDEVIAAYVECYWDPEEDENFPDLTTMLTKPEVIKLKHYIDWIIETMDTTEQYNDEGNKFSFSLIPKSGE